MTNYGSPATGHGSPGSGHEEKGILTTFHEMLSDPDRKKRFDHILIPKIQRDYAQGRKGREKIRKRFLERLFSAIDTSDSEPKELDFIYGQQKEDTYDFEPIDGQQRLTTLFLLHLYLGKRSGQDVAALRNFTYDTRDSSKEFCLKLISIPGDAYRGIREYIENQWWFTLRWKQDPTIASMLTMLADIDAHYSEMSQEKLADIWTRLTDEGKIRFWRLNLKELDTTDELYIKMNSRGKPLTDFEHFKAEIEGYLKAEETEEEDSHAADKFSLKVDTTWTELLWEYRDDSVDGNPKKYGSNGLDRMFLNIFRRFMIIEATKAGEDYNALEKTDILTLSEKVLKTHPERIERFTSIMDFFAGLPSVKEFFDAILTPEAEEVRVTKQIPMDAAHYRVYLHIPLDGDTDYLLRCAWWDHMTNANMLMLEAFFHYAASSNAVHYPAIREKIRIARNLIINSPDELRAAKMGTLLQRVDAIIDGEPLDGDASNGFRQNQIKQEINKLHYIEKHPEDEWIVKFTENHKALRGNLSIYMTDTIIETQLLPLHTALFHERANYLQIERALLTFGDYGTAQNERRQYGGNAWWRWRDDIFTADNKVTAPVLRQALLSLPGFDEETLERHISAWLKEQENNKAFTWPYYMVRHKGMLHGQEARYQKEADFISYDYMMMNRTNRNGKHWNPYLFCLSSRMKDLDCKLEEYGSPLIFEKAEISVKFYEDRLEITYKDGHQEEIGIPQEETDGVKIDTEDRIDFAEKKLRPRGGAPVIR